MGQAPRKKQVPKAKVAAAFEFEKAIADEAVAIRAEHAQATGVAVGDVSMTRALFLKLWPLLRRPIPEGFLVEVTAGEGKPYDSKGVKSVDVQIARMDNVLTPLWWDYRHEYEEDGKRCLVTVAVHGADGECLVSRSSWGGMNRGSTQGNLWKGSFTNAAKLAFARVGPGHEVYVGGTDLEPDTDPDTAKLQAKRERSTRVERENTPGGGSENGAAARPASAADEAAALRMLLATKDGLEDKRAEANTGMELLGAGVGQRLRELQSHQTADELNELIQRVSAAADAMAAEGDGAPR